MRKTIETMYSPETLRRLQEVELDIFKIFIAICKKHDLQYFGLYGTALGAVRHAGIIPWDDDNDVEMPRKDYDKLVEVLPQELPQRYTFLSGQTNPNYPFMTARLMRDGTEFRTLSMKNIQCPLGIFLDIFPMDQIPDDEKERKAFFRRCWIWEKLTILRNMPFPNLPYRGLKRYLVYTLCMLGNLGVRVFSREFLHAKAQKARLQYQDTVTKNIGYCFGLTPSKHMYACEELFPAQLLPFEDISIAVPHDTDAILTRFYGPDYMTPLPEGKRSFIIPYLLRFEEPDNG